MRANAGYVKCHTAAVIQATRQSARSSRPSWLPGRRLQGAPVTRPGGPTAATGALLEAPLDVSYPAAAGAATVRGPFAPAAASGSRFVPLAFANAAAGVRDRCRAASPR